MEWFSRHDLLSVLADLVADTTPHRKITLINTDIARVRRSAACVCLDSFRVVSLLLLAVPTRCSLPRGSAMCETECDV